MKTIEPCVSPTSNRETPTRRTVLATLTATAALGPLAGFAATGFGSSKPRVSGSVLFRGTQPYEIARESGVWQAAKPDRYPDLIVQANSTSDVIEVLRYARARRLTVAVKGSGHNYTGTYLRRGGVLLDLSMLKQASIEPSARRAWAQPGIRSGELAQELLQRGQAFPTGHHAGVGLGGYLLGGGMGWNGESWGQFACFNVGAIDVVTAAGEALTIGPKDHPDLFWAARGAGPFFCAVATGFHLNTYPAPGVMLASSYRFPLSVSGRIARWLQPIANEARPGLDLFLLLLTEQDGRMGAPSARSRIAQVNVVSYGADRAQAEESLRRVARDAPLAQVLDRQEFLPMSFPDLYAESLTGPARRTAADTAWTNDTVAATEIVADHFRDVPSPATVGIINYRAPPRFPTDAAFSMAGMGFVQWLGQWDRAEDDAVNFRWVDEVTDGLAPVTVGAYVNECDLLRRPDRAPRCFAPAAWKRLGAVRAAYDPGGLLPPPISV